MNIFWNLIGLAFVIIAFFIDNEQKMLFALILGNMFIIAAALYSKLKEIEAKIK